VSLWLAPTAFAQPAGEPTYWKDIRPILRKNCTACHSTKNLKEVDVSGGLALDTYEAIKKGGLKPVLHIGKAKDSELVKLLVIDDTDKRMPLAALPLPKEQIDLIRRWIDTGAKEGVPEGGSDVPVPTTPRRTRKLDVTLPTSAAPPKGALGNNAAGKLELVLKVGPLAPVAAVTFSPDGKLLASGSYGQVTIWDLTTAQPVKVLTNVLGAVNDLRFSPDSKLLAAAGGQPSAKGDLRLYQVSDWKLLGTLRGHDDVVFSISFAPDGKHLASASFDKTVRVWNVASQKSVVTHTGHSDFVYAVSFSPDGKHLVSASKDRTVKLVEALTGKSVYTFSGMDQDVLAVAFSPDGKQVVSSGFEAGIYWWNPQKGEKVRVQNGHGIAVHELCFSKDGQLVVSAGADRTVRLWNGATGAPVRTLSVGSMVYAVAISPDRKLVASGSFDGLTRLWDVQTGRHLLTFLSLPAAKDHFDWLALTPEGYAGSSTELTKLGRWRVAGQTVAADAVWKLLRQPSNLARAARGEAVPTPTFSK
jgi:Tol biopolymer transport system component